MGRRCRRCRSSRGRCSRRRRRRHHRHSWPVGQMVVRRRPSAGTVPARKRRRCRSWRDRFARSVSRRASQPAGLSSRRPSSDRRGKCSAGHGAVGAVRVETLPQAYAAVHPSVPAGDTWRRRRYTPSRARRTPLRRRRCRHAGRGRVATVDRSMVVMLRGTRAGTRHARRTPGEGARAWSGLLWGFDAHCPPGLPLGAARRRSIHRVGGCIRCHRVPTVAGWSFWPVQGAPSRRIIIIVMGGVLQAVGPQGPHIGS